MVTKTRAFGINNAPESHRSGSVVIPRLYRLLTHYCAAKCESNPLASSVDVTALVGLMTGKPPTQWRHASSSFFFLHFLFLLKPRTRLLALNIEEASVEKEQKHSFVI